eukprot:CAMPEP_0197485356 /NCGR_PEP_ID=MMETSP1311-20131121/329_1 /TAXON_ID=464262 /ORGANISM="Genus nov. species nov., Strain RCC856" /LENGTH=142 /DNA_ID=CAMNT_0043028041 /DNA_START=94 /DNA_END=523 /DNA_ORIENTATION=+
MMPAPRAKLHLGSRTQRGFAPFGVRACILLPASPAEVLQGSAGAGAGSVAELEEEADDGVEKRRSASAAEARVLVERVDEFTGGAVAAEVVVKVAADLALSGLAQGVPVGNLRLGAPRGDGQEQREEKANLPHHHRRRRRLW